MSYIVRDVTVRKAEELLRDLRANVDHKEYARDFEESISDKVLLNNIELWLCREQTVRNHETEMAKQNEKRTNEER